NAVLALLDLDFGSAADLDHRNAAGQLRETLLELLTIIVGGGDFDLLADLLDAALDGFGVTGAIDDRGVVLVDRDTLGLAQHLEGDVLELDTEIFADHLAVGQDGDVLEHGLTAIAEARRLDGRDLEAAAQLVDDERGKRLAL